MIDRVGYDECCQCNNCKLVCPTNAITFSKVEKMFVFPKIDAKKCIHCNKCENVCPVLTPIEQSKVLGAFAAKHKDKKVRLRSSSGGIFHAFSEEIIRGNGIVYGAVFQDDFTVKHTKAKAMDEADRFRGSKYVRSELNECICEIVELLKNGKTVLFSGTPCQCAALRVFLSKHEYCGKIYIVDFVCHGILSEKLFREYMNDLETRRKSKVQDFEFRNKKYGWNDSGPMIKYENGHIDSWPLYEDVYMQGYFQGICMRESCYNCKYKNFHSGSDVTMGDFWGAEQLAPQVYDYTGISMLVVNTETGKELLRLSEKTMDLEPMPLELMSKYNQGLFTPFPKGEKSDEFYELEKKMGGIQALKELTRAYLKSHTLCAISPKAKLQRDEQTQ